MRGYERGAPMSHQGKVNLPLYFLSLGGCTQVQEGSMFCKSPRTPPSPRRPGLSQRGALVQATHWLRKAKRYLMTTMTTRGRVMRICWIWCTLSAGFSSSVTKGAFQGTFHPHRPMQTTFVSLPVRSLWLRW